MEHFLNAVNVFFTSFDADYSVFMICCAAWNALSVAIFLAGFLFKSLGKTDKFPLLALTFSAYFLVLAKTFSDVFSKKPLSGEAITAELTSAAISLFIFGALKIQTIVLGSGKTEDFSDDTETSDIRGDLFSPAVKRIEVLPTEKFRNTEETDFRLDPSEIKNYLFKLRKKDLEISEEDELDKIEIDLGKFSYRRATETERKVFSERLEKMLKMVSKYGIA
ncbi:MAG TPA: hypothetical protein DDW54_04380 [Clostridiales bacterium]|nr:hypothetical protein [Clostridiales bacterium]